MPQPLSRVKPGAHIFLSSSLGCKTYPDLAAKVAQCIAMSALIENLLMGILASMLGTHAKPAAAMLGALQSLSVKRSAIKAAAEEALSADDMDLFTAVIDECDSACKHRHRFVHWAWAIAKHYHGEKELRALLFIDPKTLLAHEAHAQGYVHPHEGSGLYDKIDKAGVLVYREPDLDAAVVELSTAYNHLSLLRMITIKGGQVTGPIAPLRNQLSGAHQIARRLDQLRARQKSAPAD